MTKYFIKFFCSSFEKTTDADWVFVNCAGDDRRRAAPPAVSLLLSQHYDEKHFALLHITLFWLGFKLSVALRLTDNLFSLIILSVNLVGSL